MQVFDRPHPLKADILGDDINWLSDKNKISAYAQNLHLTRSPEN
ncbi:MAG: hypothetical protein ACJAYR_002999 [Sneathiella sp.]|jgi:hypothetical protein